MLQLLQPIWLFAIAGVIAPVVIHLWNNKRGKVLAIGSIAFLEKTSRKKARSRKISEWLLLLLRCLLLVLLAFLLAGPYWKKEPGVGNKGWVLVGEEPGGFKAMIDSLVKKGYERHDMKGGSWWRAFTTLDRQAPAGVPFYVFTDGLLRHFSGMRPETNRPVYWYTDPASDSIVRWVDKTWLVGHDSVGTITGSSGSTGSTYGYREMVGKPGISVDTTALRVVVYSEGIDGQWVTAALQAVQQFTRRNIIISKKVMDADWVFWLSAQPLPPGLKAANVLFYEPGKEIPVDTWVRGNRVAIEKEVPSLSSDGLEPVWADGFGRPLLGLEETAHGRRFHFFSHFDPAWNGLVWSADFPQYLEELLFEKEGGDHDRRIIDTAQIVPGRGMRASRGVAADEATIDLGPAGWVLIWLLLLTERILAFKKRNSNG